VNAPSPGKKLVDRFLELLARLEARHVGAADLDLFAGLRIAPSPALRLETWNVPKPTSKTFSFFFTTWL